MALVYGCGTLGLLHIAALNACYPHATIIAIARHPRQVDLARQMGAKHIIRVRHPAEIVAAISELVGSPVRRPNYGLPWLMGGVDVIYDTVGSPETLEVGLRITRPRGRIVVTGVSRPKRFEWTPHYFKEIELVGSNAFGVEDFEGQRLHAMQIYLGLVSQGRISLPSFITHRYRLEQYREALLVGHNKDKHQAIKVIFDFR